MIVLVLERVPAALRGELTRWLQEVKAGVFIGRVTATVRDRLWDRVCTGTQTGSGFLVYPSDCEQGYALRSHGHGSRRVVDFDGLALLQHPCDHL